MAFSVSLRNEPVAAMNITPLVDVMLVLLIIFMVSAPMLARPLDATLPQPSPVPSPPIPSLLLEISADGSYHLDSRPLGLPELQERLRQAAINDPRTTVSLRADAQSSYQTAVTAMAAARDSGIVAIGMRP